MLQGRRIALCVSGGIAAYKACEILRELQRKGAEVRVAMTRAAQAFVGPLTFQNLSGHPVLTDPLDAGQDALFGHLELAKWAELFVLAPATADVIARVRAGLADDAVTTSLLAFRGTVLVAPAMNVAMYENPITQANLAALLATGRFRQVGPEAGLLACGDVGAGRLVEPKLVAEEVARLLGKRDLDGQHVLITAGPTREHLDPVRFLSNPSSGKMGIALAQAARQRGASVTVVLGPTQAPLDRAGLEIVDVVSAEEMARAVLERVEAANVFVACAAVSDWRPKERATQKKKKGEGDEAVTLERTPDVLLEASKRVSGRSPRPMLVGFAAETERVIDHAREKLDRKGLDLIVANQVGAAGAGFEGDDNRVVVLTRSSQEELHGSKRQVADGIWDRIVAYASGSSGNASRP